MHYIVSNIKEDKLGLVKELISICLPHMDIDDWCIKESESFEDSKEIHICDEFGRYCAKIDDFSNSLRQLDSKIEFNEHTCTCHSGWHCG